MRRGKMAHHEKDDSGVHGVTGVVIGSEDIDVEDGVAGIDSNGLLYPTVIYPIVEEYSNHLGNTDDFTQTGTTGNGTASSDATNHEMDLSTGISAVGHARFESKKTWTLGTQPIVINFIFQNAQNGADGAVRTTHIGMKDDFSSLSSLNSCSFIQLTSGAWYANTKNGSTGTTTLTTASDGDLLTIVLTSSSVKYYVNGTLEVTHTSNIPTVTLHLGAMVGVSESSITVAREVSIDLMDIVIYS